MKSSKFVKFITLSNFILLMTGFIALRSSDINQEGENSDEINFDKITLNILPQDTTKEMFKSKPLSEKEKFMMYSSKTITTVIEPKVIINFSLKQYIDSLSSIIDKKDTIK